MSNDASSTTAEVWGPVDAEADRLQKSVATASVIGIAPRLIELHGSEEQLMLLD